MAEIDRMFRSELAVLAEQQSQSDLWALDPVLDTPFDLDDDASTWNAPLDIPSTPDYSPHSALGLFPAPDSRLGGSTPADPFLAHPQPTVHLSDVTLGIPSPTPAVIPPVQIPLSTSQSSEPLTQSPSDSLLQTDPSSEEMDSDEFDLTYHSDSEYLPSPVSINPATLSAPSTSSAMDTNADILAHAVAMRPSRRPSRTITKVPVPIPNLTKKSRGRKVPTSDGGPVYAASKDKTKKGVRTYTCHAEGCGKCFVRGEHLKRHIRSIHTEEKPWECTYKDCNRTFSRRDNLNQHLRIHRMQDGDD